MICSVCGMKDIPDALDECPSCGLAFITDRIYNHECEHCHHIGQVRVPRVFHAR